MEKLAISRDFYASSIGAVRSSINEKQSLKKRIDDLNSALLENQKDYMKKLGAKKILSTISDDRTQATLGVITSMVNKVLAEILPDDPYTIELVPTLHAGKIPHLVLKMYDGEGHVLDILTQSGDGVKQIVCFMYVICLIEIRKGRRLIILDERLNGLHKSAKRAISKIIEIFAKGGYQFILVEYSLNDIGKIYNVEKKGNSSRLVAMEGEYNDEMIYTGDVDLSILDENYEDDEEE